MKTERLTARSVKSNSIVIDVMCAMFLNLNIKRKKEKNNGDFRRDENMKKFELTTDFIIFYGIKLFRIRALIEFGDVKAGEVGGYIEKEKNLSQLGEAWVSDNAKVFGEAKVSGNAWVSGKAEVSGNATVFGNTLICG